MNALVISPNLVSSVWDSRRLWSLWDMLKLNAASFYGVTTTLGRIGSFLARLPGHAMKERMFEGEKRAQMRGDLLADLTQLKTEMATLGTDLSSVSLGRFIKSI